MLGRSSVYSAFALALSIVFTLPQAGYSTQLAAASTEDGIVKVKSVYGFGETRSLASKLISRTKVSSSSLRLIKQSSGQVQASSSGHRPC